MLRRLPVQFVDFSHKCLSGIIEIYRSIDSEGSPKVFQQLKDTAERPRSSNVRLKTSLDQDRLGRPPTESENKIIVVATECADIAATLLEVLRDFDLPDGGYSRLKKIRVGVKAVWNGEKLETLQQKLKDLRDQLMFVILLDLR